MVWPVGELQEVLQRSSSCLWGRGGEGERQEGEREERFTNFLILGDLSFLISNMPKNRNNNGYMVKNSSKNKTAKGNMSF